MQHSNAPTDLAAVLILVTGLPAAGKSSFLDAAERYADAQEDQSFPLFAGGCHGRIAAVLQLDRALHHALPQRGEESTTCETLCEYANEPSDPHVFSPLRWKQATQRLLQMTEHALRECVSRADKVGAADNRCATVPLIFVEDNMHLRSMRERYYRLCRHLEEEVEGEEKKVEDACAHTPSKRSKRKTELFIGMLELRFVLPLSVCIERNARRRTSPSPSSSGVVMSPYIPTPVIVSMDAIFDRCLDSNALTRTASNERKSDDASTKRWWRWTPSTQPWSLLELNIARATRIIVSEEKGEASADDDLRLPGVEELVDEFFATTLQSATQEALQAQYTRVLQGRVRRREATNSSAPSTKENSAATCVQSRMHALDVQLRAITHTFLKEQQQLSGTRVSALSPNVSVFGKDISKLKKIALQRFKDGSRHTSCTYREPFYSLEEDNEEKRIAELHEMCLMEYQQSLLSLWKQEEAVSFRTQNSHKGNLSS